MFAPKKQSKSSHKKNHKQLLAKKMISNSLKVQKQVTQTKDYQTPQKNKSLKKNQSAILFRPTNDSLRMNSQQGKVSKSRIKHNKSQHESKFVVVSDKFKNKKNYVNNNKSHFTVEKLEGSQQLPVKNQKKLYKAKKSKVQYSQLYNLSQKIRGTENILKKSNKKFELTPKIHYISTIPKQEQEYNPENELYENVSKIQTVVSNNYSGIPNPYSPQTPSHNCKAIEQGNTSSQSKSKANKAFSPSKSYESYKRQQLKKQEKPLNFSSSREGRNLFIKEDISKQLTLWHALSQKFIFTDEQKEQLKKQLIKYKMQNAELQNQLRTTYQVIKDLKQEISLRVISAEKQEKLRKQKQKNEKQSKQQVTKKINEMNMNEKQSKCTDQQAQQKSIASQIARCQNEETQKLQKISVLNPDSLEMPLQKQKKQQDFQQTNSYRQLADSGNLKVLKFSYGSSHCKKSCKQRCTCLMDMFKEGNQQKKQKTQQIY